MSFKLLQHRRQVGAFLEQQLPVQLENVLQVARGPKVPLFGLATLCGISHRFQ
ncbi:hypothetical protein [Salmonella enterica]|uniref:hypothetical protein n=1 Tax=Salmonella enterica TaxID=28901 RepID=UPI00398B5A84